MGNPHQISDERRIAVIQPAELAFRNETGEEEASDSEVNFSSSRCNGMRSVRDS